MTCRPIECNVFNNAYLVANLLLTILLN